MGQDKVYERFDIHQRIQHMGMFTSFFVLTLTGLPIKFEQSSFAQGVVSTFGGFDNLYYVHLLGAVLMIFVSVYHLIYLVVVPLGGKRKSWAIMPNGKDFKDLLQNLGYFFGFRKEPARFDRYSYKEKFDYWAVFWGMFIMGGSGLMMWYPQFVTQFLPRWVIDSSRYAHTDEAILAISAIFIWHFYNVHFNTRSFPMSKVWYVGTMNREEMEEEHPVELERIKRERNR
ncbi:formate dehydrogenase subunit gamma [Desulfitobacterium dichloroeliminans]|uniref:formate dehydrogenase subunit gamma n=1 Tax=Desulfitobacterium dichloroeliminans TaxID=233055 RepID=UPI0002498E8C|nr:cytochrome b/b6 domain-containing protein [Desulfitobacterium dichloroeliminans]